MECGDRTVTFVEQCQTTNQYRSRKLFAKSHIQQKGNRDVEQLSHVEYATNANSSPGESQLYIFEDKGVIKMIDHYGQKSNDETRVMCRV